jgi:Protein of unknown function (DUF4238)
MLLCVAASDCGKIGFGSAVFAINVMPLASPLQVSSHTVPKRLLRAFSYPDPKTGSPRLWRYEKNRKPYWKASPETSTAAVGHFADPEDALREKQIESRLAYKIEDPVNAFMDDMRDPMFAPSIDQKKQLTRYITLLALRSEARRDATDHDVAVRTAMIERFMSNQEQVATVAAHWNIESVLRRGEGFRLATRGYVLEIARALLTKNLEPTAMQSSYAERISVSLDGLNEPMFHGSWIMLSVSPDNPFILGDAPVATWVRQEADKISLGEGYLRPDVEVFLPVSPTTCWHILPKVRRTRKVRAPKALEVIAAQACFAKRSCFANLNSSLIDQIVQKKIATFKLGVTGGTMWHQVERDYCYDLMLKLIDHTSLP